MLFEVGVAASIAQVTGDQPAGVAGTVKSMGMDYSC